MLYNHVCHMLPVYHYICYTTMYSYTYYTTMCVTMCTIYVLINVYTYTCRIVYVTCYLYTIIYVIQPCIFHAVISVCCTNRYLQAQKCASMHVCMYVYHCICSCVCLPFCYTNRVFSSSICACASALCSYACLLYFCVMLIHICLRMSVYVLVLILMLIPTESVWICLSAYV